MSSPNRKRVVIGVKDGDTWHPLEMTLDPTTDTKFWTIHGAEGIGFLPRDKVIAAMRRLGFIELPLALEQKRV